MRLLLAIISFFIFHNLNAQNYEGLTMITIETSAFSEEFTVENGKVVSIVEKHKIVDEDRSETVRLGDSIFLSYNLRNKLEGISKTESYGYMSSKYDASFHYNEDDKLSMIKLYDSNRELDESYLKMTIDYVKNGINASIINVPEVVNEGKENVKLRFNKKGQLVAIKKYSTRRIENTINGVDFMVNTLEYDKNDNLKTLTYTNYNLTNGIASFLSSEKKAFTYDTKKNVFFNLFETNRIELVLFETLLKRITSDVLNLEQDVFDYFYSPNNELHASFFSNNLENILTIENDHELKKLISDITSETKFINVYTYNNDGSVNTISSKLEYTNNSQFNWPETVSDNDDLLENITKYIYKY